jgi:hypothetical protein
MRRGEGEVEARLRDLAEALAGEVPNPAGIHISDAIPSDLADKDHRSLDLGGADALAFDAALAAFEADLRFEAVSLGQGTPYRDALWRYACLCDLRPDEDHLTAFIASHRSEPEERTCFFGVEALVIRVPLELSGVRLLPVDHEDVPPAEGRFTLEPPVGAVLAVPVSGSNLQRMKRRAEVPARHALRLLRLAIPESRFVNELQLRFRLGDGYSFGPRLFGWQTHADARWEIELDSGLLATVIDRPLARLPAAPETRIGRQAERALRWIDQATVSPDRVNAMLFGFFALEAMLGARDQGLKAADLAFKRAMLSVAVSGEFSDPERIRDLYAEVRSDAVHGGEPDLSEQEFHAFSADIRDALREYLDLAEREEILTRGAMIKLLLAHPKRPELEEWLLEHGGPAWEKYIRGQAP